MRVLFQTVKVVECFSDCLNLRHIAYGRNTCREFGVFQRTRTSLTLYRPYYLVTHIYMHIYIYIYIYIR